MRSLLLLALCGACIAQDEALLQRLGSTDAAARVQTMQAIHRMTREEKAALAKRVADAPPELAMRLWRALRDDAPVDALVPLALRSAGPSGRAWWTALAKERKVPSLIEGPPLSDDVLIALLGPVGEETRPDRPVLSPAPTDLPAWLALATHRSPSVRAALARWLDGIAGKDARVTLEALTRDGASCVRVEALRSLAHRIADRRDQRSFLWGFLTDPSPGVRAEAVRLFRPCGSTATDIAAWSRLGDPSPLVRGEAVAYLISRESPWVMPYLVRLIASAPGTVPQHAEEQAIDLGMRNPLAVVHLAECLDRIPREALPVAIRLLDRLSREARWPGPTGAPLVVPAPSDPVAAWCAWAKDARVFLASDAPRRLAQADAALSKQDAARAEPILKKLLEEYPRLPHALSLMAQVCEIGKRVSEAREWLSKAIEADPAEFSYRTRRGALASDAGDHAAALADYEAAVRLNPKDVTARFKHGFELLSVGRYAEGVEEFCRVVAQDPSSLDARYNIACGLARMGNAEGALEALEDAFAAGFNDADAARKDEDLASLRDDPRFEEILTRERTGK